jgi:hypothetical protein
VLAVGMAQFHPRLSPEYGTRQISLCLNLVSTVTPPQTPAQPWYSVPTSAITLSSIVMLRSSVADGSLHRVGHHPQKVSQKQNREMDHTGCYHTLTCSDKVGSCQGPPAAHPIGAHPIGNPVVCGKAPHGSPHTPNIADRARRCRSESRWR